MAVTIKGIDWANQLSAATLTTAPASDAQALAKSADDKAVTPANLAAIGSTATFSGLVELATTAEAIAGSDTDRAVTPAGVAAVTAKLDIISFSGKNGTGACTLAGVKVNDVVLSVTGQVAADVGDKASLFESAITVADQIQQSSASDLSTKVYMALILRKS
jgi:hypothetical protein